MDKNKQTESIYPSASRGLLANEQIHKKYESKPLTKTRDYSPATLILQAVLVFLGIAILAVGAYAYYYTQIRKTKPDTAAYAIAKKYAELNSSQSYEALETETASVFNWCKAPIITISYDNGGIRDVTSSDKTVINTGNIKDLDPVFSEITTKSGNSVSSTYDITCPDNPSI
jgi:hypothetical protein